MQKLILFANIYLLLSCVNTVNTNPNENLKSNKPANKVDTSLYSCIPKDDTIIEKSNSLKYLIQDSFFTLKVQVNGLDTLLPYKFDCNTPKGLIPTFYSYHKGMFCLIRGSAFDYREFVLVYESEGEIILKNYETALVADLKRNLVVYRNYKQPEKIEVENIKTGKKKVFLVPNEMISAGIPNVFFLKNGISLIYSNGRKFHFAFE